MARKSLSDAGVQALKPRGARYAHPDPELKGHFVRVTPAGVRSFVAVARDPNGRQVWATVGSADKIGIEAARDAAREAIKRIRAGLPAIEPKASTTTFKAVAQNFLRRHVDARGLRSAPEIRRMLDKYVYPRWEGRQFTSIGRRDVATLLDEVEDGHGPSQADAVLAVVRSVANWFAARDDNFVSPIIRGMKRSTPTKRDRTLTDAEIRAVWQAASRAGTYGDIVQLALCTGQRREKILSMRWADVSVDGVWSIPSEDREKGTPSEIRLPRLALDVVRRRNRVGENEFVFAGRRSDRNFSGVSKAKRALDEAAGVEGWRFHDLRRTARSLLSRAGVPSDLAERVLGHAIAGVRGVYDRHTYRDEVADALARLDVLLRGIIDPQANVVPIRGRQ